jgi:hypothetical protein
MGFILARRHMPPPPPGDTPHNGLAARRDVTCSLEAAHEKRAEFGALRFYPTASSPARNERRAAGLEAAIAYHMSHLEEVVAMSSSVPAYDSIISLSLKTTTDLPAHRPRPDLDRPT